MTWSCVKCGSSNPRTEQQCHNCGARLPFLPPTDSEVSTASTETFRVPRKGELTALLHHGIEQLRAGVLSPAEFQERVEAALENVPLVFSTIIQEIQETSEELPGYGDGVITSLSDCQVLFESGLTELLHFTDDQDDFHLRFGWLLLEKGEHEYVEILQALQRDAANRPFLGADNVLGRLCADFEKGSLDQKAFQAELTRFNEVCQQTLLEIGEVVQSGIQIASKAETDSMDEAALQMETARELMGGLLLNLYAVADSESAG